MAKIRRAFLPPQEVLVNGKSQWEIKMHETRRVPSNWWERLWGEGEEVTRVRTFRSEFGYLWFEVGSSGKYHRVIWEPDKYDLAWKLGDLLLEYWLEKGLNA